MSLLANKLFGAATRWLWPSEFGGRLCILYYHRVLAQPDPLVPGLIDARMFAQQLRALSSVFHMVPLGQALERLDNGTLPPLSLAITFDDGYVDNLDIAVPILQQHQLSATFYLTTGFVEGAHMYSDQVIEAVRRLPTGNSDFNWLGLGTVHISDMDSRRRLMHRLVHAIKYLDPQARLAACARLKDAASNQSIPRLMMHAGQIQQLHRHGMEIGGHTVSHPILENLPDEDAMREITQNRDDLASITGTAPTLFAYPNGKPGIDFSARHERMVMQAGYTSAVATRFGCATTTTDRFALPRLSPWDRSESLLIARILRMFWRGDANIAHATASL